MLGKYHKSNKLKVEYIIYFADNSDVVVFIKPIILN